MKTIKTLAGMIAVILSSNPLAAWALKGGANNSGLEINREDKDGLAECMLSHEKSDCLDAAIDLSELEGLESLDKVKLLVEIRNEGKTKNVPPCEF
jgi:hypothetical protein